MQSARRLALARNARDVGRPKKNDISGLHAELRRGRRKERHEIKGDLGSVVSAEDVPT
jgi:hypothetical protein